MKIKGKREQVTQIRARCLVCGKSNSIRIRKESHRILSNWYFFGKLEIPNSDKKVDYWECHRCVGSGKST